MFIGEHPRIPFGYPKLPNSYMLITQHWPSLRWSKSSFKFQPIGLPPLVTPHAQIELPAGTMA